MPSFEERFAELRKKHNVKQKDIADLLGVSIRAVQYYETGERRPDFDGLLKLADFFDVSLDYLVGRSDNPNRH